MKYAKLSASLVKLFELGLKYSSKTTFKNNKFGDVLSYINDNALKKISIDEICEEDSAYKEELWENTLEAMAMEIEEKHVNC